MTAALAQSPLAWLGVTLVRLWLGLRLWFANIDEAIYLYKSNVIWLAPVPIYLYPNVTYRLTVRIEQDPVKLWPFREMCDETVLAHIQATDGYTVEQLIPFCVQMRGLWHKNVRTPDPDPSLFHNLSVWPPDPEFQMGPGVFMDKYYGHRAFRTGLVLHFGDDPAITIPMHDPAAAVVSHQGDNVPFSQGLPGTPKEYVYSYSRDYTGVLHPSIAKLGIDTHTYSGDRWTVTVETDGYCITTVTAESEGKEIRVSIHCEQDDIGCPQGLGTNLGTTVECFAEPSGGGADVLHYTYTNDLPWSAMGNPGFGRDLGAYQATQQMHATDSFGPRETTWLGGTDYSLDGDEYDWEVVGVANATHSAGVLCAGESYLTALSTPGDPSDGERFEAQTYSIALAGAGVIQYNNSSGGFDPMEPYAMASDVGVSDAAVFYAEAVANYGKWRDAAKARVPTFNTVVDPPRIKISGSFEVVNVMGAPASFALFGELGVYHQAEVARLGFGDIAEVEADAVEYDSGSTHYTVHDYVSDDWFSRTTIQNGVLNCELKLGWDGFSSQWLTHLDEFDELTTIPESKFGPLRPETFGLVLDKALDDTFIHDQRDSITYQSWLTL